METAVVEKRKILPESTLVKTLNILQASTLRNGKPALGEGTVRIIEDLIRLRQLCARIVNEEEKDSLIKELGEII